MTNNPTLKEQIEHAMDALQAAKRSSASYDELKACAVTILELRQQAEKAYAGKVKTRITQLSISSLIR